MSTRDTNNWYLDQDPFALVDQDIIALVAAKAGPTILDLGCGTGGYGLQLQQQGFSIEAADINAQYVKLAQQHGLTQAKHISGAKLPYDDKSVDTVMMVEVIEHLDDQTLKQVLLEAKRVAKTNVIITTPNSSQEKVLSDNLLTYSHMLEKDHKQFYNHSNLNDKLGKVFKTLSITEANPIYPHRLLPKIIAKPISLLYKLGLLKPRLYYRYYIEAKV